MEKLSDAEAGRLFRALLKYSMTGKVEELRGQEETVFPAMQFFIDRDKQKYEDTCKKNRSSVMSRYEQPTTEYERRQTNTTAYESYQSKSKSKSKSKSECTNSAIERSSPKSATPYREIIDAYNSICLSLPRIIKLTDQRKRAISARYQDVGCSLDEMRSVFQQVESSDFLT